MRLEADLGQDVPSAFADRHRLQQVFWNVLSNAVKFTGTGGLITVTLRRANGSAEVRIGDSGVGIRRDVLPFVFDRFRQADSSPTRRHGGSVSVSPSFVTSSSCTAEPSRRTVPVWDMARRLPSACPRSPGEGFDRDGDLLARPIDARWTPRPLHGRKHSSLKITTMPATWSRACSTRPAQR